MSKFIDKIYKNSVWFVIILSLIAYFAYRVMSFNGDIGTTLTDYQTYVQLLFVIFLNINMVSAALDSATNQGINCDEFDLADKLNNKLIESVNNEMTDFREYIKKLNHHELLNIQEDYLFKVGDKKVEDLTDKELKAYNNLKPLRHNIYGFNLPLYYELSKNHEIKYSASIKVNQGKRKKQIKKIFTGALFGGMTINMMFAVENVGAAFTSLLIIMVGLALTYIMTFVPQLFKFKVALPKKVILKNTLYNGYVSYKNGTHKLKELKKDEETNNITVVDNDSELHTEDNIVREQSVLG